jgi:hypothetical protein
MTSAKIKVYARCFTCPEIETTFGWGEEGASTWKKGFTEILGEQSDFLQEY